MLYLIPTVLHPEASISTLSPAILETISKLDYFLAEDVRTCRRFISSLKLGRPIETLEIGSFHKDTKLQEVQNFTSLLLKGSSVGYVSEAGCPGIADPGAVLVAWAHQHQVPVFPLVGPSSIVLSLMGSGFNGQEFTFHGYVPFETELKIKKLKAWETDCLKTGYTQLFMDTPYRNNQLLDVLINHLKSNTLLSISSELTSNAQRIQTKSIHAWKLDSIDLNKKPVIFGIGKFEL
jgi:16S rRNA (cytidine1402-2'-O)-methyltransferase